MGLGDMVSGALSGTIGLGTGLAAGLLGGGEAPPAPDTAGMIAAQSKANKEAARLNATLNNPNLINQYGTTTYTTGADGRDIQTQTLSPEQQALYESNLANQQATSRIAGQGLANMGGILGTQFDLSGAPTVGSAEGTRQRVIDAMMSRTDKRLGQANEQQKSDLIAAGIRPGTEAYRRAMEEQGQNRNDAMMQAELAGGQEAERAFGMDTSNRKNYIAEQLTARQQPLNEINALNSGAQQANPFAGQGYQAGAQVQPDDYQGAYNMLNQYNQNVYNQKQGQRNALLGGAAQLGSAFLLSDRRLKTDIERIGTHKLGIGIYSWKYLDIPPDDFDMKLLKMANWGGKSTGVMADELKEVMPEAVVRIGNYDAVDYSMIGE